MKKLIVSGWVLLFANVALASPSNYVSAVSRANCWAPFPFGIGGGVGWHNESVSYDPQFDNDHTLWTSSFQMSTDPKRDVTRSGVTGWQITWRSYLGVNDPVKDIQWQVMGSHWERENYIRYYSIKTYGKDCNINGGGVI